MNQEQPDARELDALRESAAFCSHELRFIVSVTGSDALAWVERIASNEVGDMGPASWVPAVLMDGKGKLQADLRVIAPGDPGDGLLLDLPAANRQHLLRLLDMYVIQDDVTVEDRSASWRIATVAGPKAGALLAGCMIDPPGPGELSRPSDDLLVLPSSVLPAPAWDLLFQGDVGRDVVGALFDKGVVRVGLPALQVVRVEGGVPWFGPDLAEGVIPLEALLDDRVSTTKGCYPGQEVVARIRNLGQVARKLVRLRAEGRAALDPGTELQGTGEREGQPAGTLTSVAFDPGAGRTFALGYVRRAFWRSGCTVSAAGVDLTVDSLTGE